MGLINYSSILEIRISLGLSTAEVSDALGIPVDDLQEFESNPGLTPISMALKMARLYNLSIDDIDFE